MLAKELIKILQSLPEDTEVTIATSYYDGCSEHYEDQEPKIIHNIVYAVLTGEHDLYAQLEFVQQLEYKNHREALRLIQSSNTIVEV